MKIAFPLVLAVGVTIAAFAADGSTTVPARPFDSVELKGGGFLQNGYGTDRNALIEGATGVDIGSGGLSGAKTFVVNYGTIIGSKTTALYISSFTEVINGGGGATSATLEGNSVGVTLTAASDHVLNYGTIEGNNGVTATQYGSIGNLGTISGLGAFFSYAISMAQGGYITNGSPTDPTALIEGLAGIRFIGAPGTIHNAGTILATGPSETAVNWFDGGLLTNGAPLNDTALIDGVIGVFLRGGAGFNYGTIEGGGAGAYGAYLADASMTNGASGHSGALIEGETGVVISGSGTLTNFGVIDGAAGPAVRFRASTATLVAEAGSVFEGSVYGDGGTLDLGSGVGTISGLFAGGDVTVSGSMATTTFDDFGALEVGAGASFTLTGTNEIAAGQSLIDDGTLKVTGAFTSSGTWAGPARSTLPPGPTR